MKKNFLRNWSISLEGNSLKLYGYIFNDEKQRFEDGVYIRTSDIVEINFQQCYIKTQNTKYNIDIPQNISIILRQI